MLCLSVLKCAFNNYLKQFSGLLLEFIKVCFDFFLSLLKLNVNHSQIFQLDYLQRKQFNFKQFLKHVDLSLNNEWKR